MQVKDLEHTQHLVGMQYNFIITMTIFYNYFLSMDLNFLITKTLSHSSLNLPLF